jgi:hypothetical protein
MMKDLWKEAAAMLVEIVAGGKVQVVEAVTT